MKWILNFVCSDSNYTLRFNYVLLFVKTDVLNSFHTLALKITTGDLSGQGFLVVQISILQIKKLRHRVFFTKHAQKIIGQQ